MDYLEANKVPFVNIGSDDLRDKNRTLILGLSWILILHFSVDSSGANKNLKKAMLDYVNEKLRQHRDEFGVDDVKTLNDDSFRDGRVFKVLNAHYVDPDKKESLSEFERAPADKIKHFDDALKDGSKELGITPLLDGVDMNSDGSVDDKAVIAQIIVYKDLENKQNEEDVLKNQLANRVKDKLKSQEKEKELQAQINDLLDWIKKNIDTMSDTPNDLHPDDLKVKEDYFDNHLKEKVPKGEEYKNVVASGLKLSKDNASKNFKSPNINLKDLLNLWKKLSSTGGDFIKYIDGLKEVYQMVQARKETFERLRQKFNKSNAKVKDDASNFSEKAKSANLSDVQRLEVILENIHADKESTEKLFENLTKFTEKKIKKVCPNQRYFDEEFAPLLNESQDNLGSMKNDVSQAENDLRDAQARLKDVKDNLRKNAVELGRIRNELDETQILLEQSPKFVSMDDFNEYVSELDHFDPERINKSLDDCIAREKENEKIAGVPVTDSYTSETPDVLKEDAAKIADQVSSKKKDLEGEKKRLADLDNKINHFNDSASKINAQLDEINAISESINNESDNEKALKQLDELQGQLKEVDSLTVTLTESINDYPVLRNQAIQLSMRLAEQKASIDEQINILNSKPALADEDMGLTDEEKQRITKEFKSQDTGNSKNLTFENFSFMAVAYPPLGVSVADKSPERKNFFDQYSSNKKTISLDETITGYQEYKAAFILKSKDKAIKLITEKANGDNQISEKNLRLILAGNIVDQIVQAIEPATKSGDESFYRVDDII